MATRIFTNTHEEIERAHALIWKKLIPSFLLVRLVTLVLLTSGGGFWTLGIDYMTLLFLYFYASKPAVAEVLLGWSIFTAIKSDGVVLESTLSETLKKLNRGIITVFIFMFIVPDIIGLLLPKITFAVAMFMVFVGSGCGILVVKLEWQTTLFLRMVYAASVAILVTTIVPFVNIGDTENTQAIEKWLVDWNLAIGIAMFFIAMGIMGAILKEGAEKTTGFLTWIFNWEHFFASFVAIVVIYFLLAAIFPQATVWVDSFLDANQKCAQSMRTGGAFNDCEEIKATPEVPVQSPVTTISKALSESVSTTSTEVPKVSTKTVGGVVVAGKINDIKSVSQCDTTPFAEKEFVTDKNTFGNLPLLATIEPGVYLVTAEGQRCQDFYEQDGIIPLYCRMKDADGNTLDDPQLAKFVVTDNRVQKMMSFPNEAYSLFLLSADGKSIKAGKSHYFSTNKKMDLKMDLNVPHTVYDYTGSGGFTVKIYKCKK
jgi:hypothetical protein